ncbi:hypothetical protein ACH4TP_37805 [Streptomyces sp. NPDC021012]|uniref:hypothetical protein n=1 Tax=Streptomyces sp. NPDC021012 TaxID=3365107 RepID=UPI0037BD85B7
MADEPTNGELARLISQMDVRMDSRLGELSSRFDKVVTLDVYTIQMTHIEQRIAKADADNRSNADAVKKLEDDFEKYQRDQATKREEDRQKRLYQAILPVLLGLISAAIALWAVVSK